MVVVLVVAVVEISLGIDLCDVHRVGAAAVARVARCLLAVWAACAMVVLEGPSEDVEVVLVPSPGGALMKFAEFVVVDSGLYVVGVEIVVAVKIEVVERAGVVLALVVAVASKLRWLSWMSPS